MKIFHLLISFALLPWPVAGSSFRVEQPLGRQSAVHSSSIYHEQAFASRLAFFTRPSFGRQKSASVSQKLSISVSEPGVYDLQSMLDLRSRVFPGRFFKRGENQPFIQRFQDFVKDHQNVFFLVAKFEARIVGVLVRELRTPTSASGEIFVHPDFRQQGVTQVLYREARKRTHELWPDVSTLQMYRESKNWFQRLAFRLGWISPTQFVREKTHEVRTKIIYTASAHPLGIAPGTFLGRWYGLGMRVWYGRPLAWAVRLALAPLLEPFLFLGRDAVWDFLNSHAAVYFPGEAKPRPIETLPEKQRERFASLAKRLLGPLAWAAGLPAYAMPLGLVVWIVYYPVSVILHVIHHLPFVASRLDLPLAIGGRPKAEGSMVRALAWVIAASREHTGFSFDAQKLAAEIHIKPYTASNAISKLHEMGFLQKIEPQLTWTSGRPRHRYQIDRTFSLLAGLVQETTTLDRLRTVPAVVGAFIQSGNSMTVWDIVESDIVKKNKVSEWYLKNFLLQSLVTSGFLSVEKVTHPDRSRIVLKKIYRLSELLRSA